MVNSVVTVEISGVSSSFSALDDAVIHYKGKGKVVPVLK
jgi:hypothetical protein